jgi:hypothetical protein
MRIMDKSAINPWFIRAFSSFLKFLKREVGGVLSPRRRVRWGLGYGLMAPPQGLKLFYLATLGEGSR